MTTLRTSSARIGWTYKVHSNTFRSSLVANEKLAQSKRPAMVSGSLLMMQFLLAVANASEVFHHNRLCSNRFSESNQLLGSNVEHLMRYGFFSSTQPLQKATSGASANAGYFGSGLANTKSAMVKRSTTDIQGFVGFWFYGGQQVLLSTINANDGSFGLDLWNVDVDSEDEIPLFADEFQLRVAPLANRDVTAFVLSSGSPDGETIASDVEIPLPADRYIEFFVDSEVPLLVGLHRPVSGNDVSEETASDLAGKLELLSDGSVELSRQGGRRGWLASVEDDFGQPVGGVAVGNGNFEQPWVVGGELQLGSPDRFHTLLLSVEVAETFNNLERFLQKGEWNRISA